MLAPGNLIVQCRAADAKVWASWDSVPGVFYRVMVTETPSGPSMVSRVLDPVDVTAASHEIDAKAGWAYSVAVTSVAGTAESEPARASAVCLADPPTGVAAVCTADRALEVSWRAPLGVAPQFQQFEIEVDGAVVGTVASTSGRIHQDTKQRSYEFRWDDAESNRSHRVRVRSVSTPLGLQLDHDHQSAWSQTSTASTCEVFKPTGLSATCNNHGVVEAKWDPINGVSSYYVEWLPQHETGSNGFRRVTTANPTWQEDEGGSYKLRVRALADAGHAWSDYTPYKTATCSEITLSPQIWMSPHIPDVLNDNARIDNVLVTRKCATTQTESGTLRICNEVWDEYLDIRVDLGNWWKRIPLLSWNSPHDVGHNIITLLGLISALRGGTSPTGHLTKQAKFSVGLAGGSQGVGYAETTSDGQVYFRMNAHPFQFADPAQPKVVGCLPWEDGGFVPRERKWDDVTSVQGNYTTVRNITLHYCENLT